MAKITALFWDVGGVLLTNGWDADARRRAAQAFGLDWGDIQARHDGVVHAFETGQIRLHEYLEQTVFWKPRPFSRDDFQKFMFEQSRPKPETLSVVSALALSRDYLMATLNNESLELNLFRIDQFDLRSKFDLFFSSCFMGTAKPDPNLYRAALWITQRNAGECLFIDDREPNVESARKSGMRTIRFENATQLCEELREHGVVWNQDIHFDKEKL